MKIIIPEWALTTAGPEDYALAREAHKRGVMQIAWPDRKTVRRWAGQQGWPTPHFGFENAFISHMLETSDNFALASSTSGLKIQMPRQSYTISAEKLGEFDALYAERSASGRPTDWGSLVEELRQIRRAIEAGVVVTVEGEQTLRSWNAFYTWAHGRYHMLEDGYDRWIGDDS